MVVKYSKDPIAQFSVLPLAITLELRSRARECFSPSDNASMQLPVRTRCGSQRGLWTAEVNSWP
jgi:hypothetical protein